MNQPLYPVNRGGSPFISTGQEWGFLNCQENKLPDFLVLYDGAVVESPVLAAPGQIRSKPAIGHDNDLFIPFFGIISVGVACQQTATKQKTRSKCFIKTNCDGALVSINIKREAKCGQSNAINKSYTIDAELCDPATALTCEQRINLLAAQVNADASRIVNATVVSTGGAFYIDLEAIEFGVPFRQTNEGLFAPDIITPFVPASLTGADVKKWFPSNDIPASMLDATNYKAVTVVTLVPTPVTTDMGSSSGGIPSYEYKLLPKTVLYLFAPDVANAATAFTALSTILTGAGTASAYFKRTGSMACGSTAMWNWCVEKTDAGDGTALTTAEGVIDDNANFVVGSFGRSYYDGTKSYYSFKLNTAAAPATVATYTNRPGTCGPDDYPCVGCTTA